MLCYVFVYGSKVLFHEVCEDGDRADGRLLDLVVGAAEEGLEATEQGHSVGLANVELGLAEVDGRGRGDVLDTGHGVTHALYYEPHNGLAKLLLDVRAEVCAELRNAVHCRVADLGVGVRKKVPGNAV